MLVCSTVGKVGRTRFGECAAIKVKRPAFFCCNLSFWESVQYFLKSLCAFNWKSVEQKMLVCSHNFENL